MLSGYAGEYADGLENLALFMGWATGIAGSLILLALSLENSKGGHDLAETLARHTQSPVPFVVDCAFDILVATAFVFTGHIVLALFYIVSIYAGKAVRDIPKDIMLRNLKSQQS